MMRMLSTIAAVMVSGTAYSQSSVVFNNRVGTEVDAPVSRGPDMSTTGEGAGAGFTAELVIVNSNGSITPLTPTTTFRTSSPAAAYYVNSVDVIIPNRAPGPVTLRMRVFYFGPSWATSFVRAQSKDFAITLGDPMLPGVNLIGLQAFSIETPEPSMLALAALGLGVLLVRHRCAILTHLPRSWAG